MEKFNPKKEDVIILAKTVLEDHIEYQDGHYEYGYQCIHCYNNYSDTKKGVTHKLHCPVLVAKDVLTGME